MTQALNDLSADGASFDAARSSIMTCPTCHRQQSEQSEREEALWCQVVLVRERLSRAERDNALLRELVELLKATRAPATSLAPTEHASAPVPSPVAARPKRVGPHVHPCQREGCAALASGRYCSQKCSALDRWKRNPGSFMRTAAPREAI